MLPRLIFVLGMGRSGTSAITRVLSFCGGSLPNRPLGANERNPTGHWEPLDVLNLNEAFLERTAAHRLRLCTSTACWRAVRGFPMENSSWRPEPEVCLRARAIATAIRPEPRTAVRLSLPQG
jgi:hypothetical protein